MRDPSFRAARQNMPATLRRSKSPSSSPPPRATLPRSGTIRSDNEAPASGASLQAKKRSGWANSASIRPLSRISWSILSAFGNFSWFRRGFPSETPRASKLRRPSSSHLSLLRCCDRHNLCDVQEVDSAKDPRVLSSGRRCVVSENVIAIFYRLVAWKALFVQRLVAGFAVCEVGISPAAGRGVLFESLTMN